MTPMPLTTNTVDEAALHADSLAAAFIARWQGTTASELSSAQSFVRELCDLLGVPPPHPTTAKDYMF